MSCEKPSLVKVEQTVNVDTASRVRGSNRYPDISKERTSFPSRIILSHNVYVRDEPVSRAESV